MTPNGNVPDEPRLAGINALGAYVKEILEVRTRVGGSTRLFVGMPPCVDASECVHVGRSCAQRDENSHTHTHTHTHTHGNGGMETVRVSKREAARERK